MNSLYFSSIKTNSLTTKPSSAIRLLLMVLLVSISPLFSYGQCSFTGTTTSVGTYTFCIDNSNTITTANVYAGQYAVLNVVKGFNYTFSYPDVFGTQNITLYNATNTSDGNHLANGSSTSALSLSWTATFSGQVYILISRGACNNSANTNFGAITITLNSIGNTQDLQTTSGTNTWVGHIYNSVIGASPVPFTNANYAGYYTINSETINEGFGGDYNCFSLLSNGSQRASIYTEAFAVRYRMQSTRAAGYYFLNANADDGIRITVDGVTVLNDWTDHANIQYCNNLIYLDGSSDIIVDYYENGGGNVVGVNLASITGNTISSYADRNVCSGTSPGVLDGSNILACTGTTNTTYQWQSSTDNANFTNISGATSEDYTPPTITTATVDVKYYRRVLKAFGVVITASNPATGSVKVTTYPPVPATPGTITGSATQCAGNTLQTYSIAAVTNATSYNWTLPANWTITAGTGTNSITVSIASNGASNNISVSATNWCGTSGSSYKYVTVSPLSSGGSIPSTASGCANTYITNLGLTGQTGNPIRWESSIDNFVSAPTVIATTANNINVTGLTQTTYYRAVVQNPPCTNIAYSNVCTVTITPTSSIASVTGTSPLCIGGTTTYSANSVVLGGGTGAWSSSNTAIATVNAAGLVTGITAGTVNIIYTITGGCGGTKTAQKSLTVSANLPASVAIAASPSGTICSGTSVTFTATPTNGGTTPSYQWKLNGANVGTNSPTYTNATLANGNTVSCVMTSSATCASGSPATSNVITATVNATATITPNKVDETCPSSNNGTISPTLSGGLSNVQYIKITQKYADWQQVAEIQAFEIFSGTNVALASNGATASSSSNYSNDVTNYGPQKAIDGDYTNYSFWHSNSTSINEYIRVDLKSGKNLDKIIIYNRVDCCQQRGQNMLLELFDASNTLVYSRTIDLYQSGANVPVNVNVLDVSWADGASTLNRTGLDSGTYTLNYADAIGCSVSSPNVIGSSATNNTWNGTAWSSGTPPTTTGTQNLVFNGNFTATTDDLAGCSCTVNTGSNVTINSGRNLIITEGVTVSGTGTLTFENSASLIQINNAAVNSGNIIYKRITSSVRNSDYTYWSSPVVGHTLNISLDYVGGIFYSYDDFASPEGWKEETATTNMQIGKGYIIRGPQIASPPPPPPPGYYTATFIGTPNNGILTKAIGPTGTSNLIGNPYPSAIYADQLLVDNQSVIEGTLYFWTHKTAIQQASNITNGTAGSGALAYTSDDYASYNLTGGVGTGSGTASTSGSDKPSGYIAAGQGFFTTSKATGSSVTFNNAMRHAGTTLADNTGINQQFFRTKKSKANTKNAIEKNRVWLNLTNTEGAFKQTLVGYITDATNEYDSRFDGETFDGNEFVDFYSINQEKNLVIQGRALPFDENDEVPLGFKSTIEGNFTISIDETDGVLANQPIFIEDKLTNTVFDLKSGNYTFKTVAGTFNDRFVLRYTNKTLGTNENEVAKNKTIVSVKNKQIKIDSFSETIDKIVIYDLLGRQIYQKDKVNSNEFIIADFVSNHAIIIIKTSLQNGDTVSNKVIY
jgi:hypothetical protein